MGARRRQPVVRALCLTFVVLAVLPVVALAHSRPRHHRHRRPRPPAGVAARLEGSFTMSGVITAAARVRGEHRGERITRTWSFTPHRCGRRSCARVVLRRGRGGGRISRITLRRTARGRYTGRGHFDVALRCLGRRHRRGALAPFSITVTITRAGAEGRAQRITATYVGGRRIDRTRCPLGPSRDAARYRGVRVASN